MKPAFLKASEVSAYVSLSTATIWKMATKGEFPKPRQLSAGRVAWLVRELDEWAESRPVSSILPVEKG